MSSMRKRIIGVVIAALMLIICPIAVFAAETGEAAVAQNSATETTYADVSDALNEAEEGQTIVLLKDAKESLVPVPENVTLDLDGHAMEATYVTCFGNIVDNSAKSAGLLKVNAERFLIQDCNIQLPVKGTDGYKFVEVPKFNKMYQEEKARYAFQPFIAKSGHALIKEGREASGVTVGVRVSWETKDGKRSQNFIYNDEMINTYLNSYDADGDKYGQMFTLVLNGAEGLGEITFSAFVSSSTGVESTSEPTVVEIKGENDNTGSGDGTEGEGPLDPGTPENPNEPGDDDIENKPENPGDNTGGEGGETDDPTVEFPEDEDGKISGNVSVDDNNLVEEAVELKKLGKSISAIVPAGVKLEEGTTKLTLTVKAKNDSDSNVETEEDEVLKPFDVHIEGIAADNTKPIIINMGEIMPVGMNIGNYTFYHIEGDETKEMKAVASVGELKEHNQFYYDPATGNVTVCMKTFSEVAVLADTDNAWKGTVATAFAGGTGTETDPYIIANADQLAYMNEQISTGIGTTAHYKLIADINFDGSKWYPIGYWKKADDTNKAGETYYGYGAAFAGVFDGNGHTVSNIYQNTWELDGNYDNGYWDDAMGLFGYVNGGTVKNITIDNFQSDGEFTPTGCVTAYAANSTFENIALINCNPRVYNTGNGGIVGIGGNSSDPDTDKLTFTNITIDNTNKISALWGSWDVACGGLVGMFRGAGHAYMTNCHVAAQIDVFNDVCGNYQYYWYRYAGMMIGTNKNMKTDDKGYTVPETDKFHAENCTVHFGEWNDYYYCELVANSLASYTHDHQFSRLTQVDSIDVENMTITVDGETTAIPTSGRVNYVVVNGEPATENATCYHFVDGKQHKHEEAGTETVDVDGDGVKETVLKEDRQHYYLPFNQLFTGYGWGVKHIPVYNGEGYAFEGITILDREVADSVEKFETKFTGDFLYRVGNQNTVSLESLFAAKDGVTINKSGVYVTIDKVNEDTNVSGTFTANKNDWTKGTIQFSGTGPVKVTIQDYDYCEPTVLYLEVVDGKNTTAATNAIGNNVVLLNDISGKFTVSNGYTFYGNGFKVTCSGNGAYSSKALSFGFITVSEGGILDNIQIICDVFPASYLYTSEMVNDSTGNYPYAYSAVAVTGNSTVSNSYIYGARNNLFIGSGNVNIENTVTECGSLSNIQIKSSDANTVTLDGVTTIQYQTTSNYDTSKKVLGFGIVVGDNESASNPTIKLTGDLKQYNWVTSNDTSVSNTYAKTAISEALKVTEYQHTVNDETTVNMGIAYLNSQTAKIEDERSNKGDIPYKLKNITMSGQTGQVYSISNSEITGDSRYDAEVDKVIPYVPKKNRGIIPSVIYNGSDSTALTFTSGYSDGESINKLVVDLDNIDGGSYNFKFSDITIQKYGVNLEFEVIDENGTAVDKDSTITLNQLSTNEYKLIIEDNLIYGVAGNIADGSIHYELPFILAATKTSIEPPKFTNKGTATAIRLVSSKGGDWRPAYTALDGISVTYWSASESKVKTVELETLFNYGTISSNVWTYTCDDYTLTITGGAVHSDGSSITPVVANNKLYFASTNKAFGTGTTSRSIILDYIFTDKNASTPWNRTETVTYSELNEYDYNSFKNNGTLTEPSSGSCLAEGTLITMADGTKRAVEDLRKGDSVMAYDHVTGELTNNDVIIVVKTESDHYENTFIFDDGTELVTINEHGIYDLEFNKYVNISHENFEDYIGHEFVSVTPDGKIGTKKLTDVKSEYKSGYKYDIVTDKTLNYVAEDTLSVTHVLVDIINTFDFDENMLYDSQKMQSDIEKYGLYTYDEWEAHAEKSVFDQYNIPVMKVGVSKGLYTKDYIIELINTYVLDESKQII